MNSLDKLKQELKPGKVYRRGELDKWSKSVDRHLAQLVGDGTLTKVATGLYHCPKRSKYGAVPPNKKELVRAYLKDTHFLLTSPNSYNGLGLGTTQLYNKYVVYNRKRHTTEKLGGMLFEFRKKTGYPVNSSEEFLLVDLLNNLSDLAENPAEVKYAAMKKVAKLDSRKLQQYSSSFGKVATQKVISEAIALRINKNVSA